MNVPRSFRVFGVTVIVAALIAAVGVNSTYELLDP
jgi:hypothetical protein